MYVCLCYGVTDTHIREAVTAQGVCSMRQLRQTLGVAGQCGQCGKHAHCILKECLQELPDYKHTARDLPVLQRGLISEATL
ncbi:bacterioferritin-associated ferredoxin [Beggiatoa leptomitoformis]|uniref:Bacterioferritin-associated ferredoxin n=1 Tax=Beggiatoa leptomitoformis TaxID=288004 RepID=A0A650GCM3_9GAMM|nr:bacterioferritin-associated ferredoxin [Beggiatoa leptomitoformis]QGX03497.1 (2Fe-2S)-binding protein [Beggiatoa leptomitoformis]QGX04034.1 (2Fe-2S)-binding protein [Beggiatoa leptomitoformis]